MNVNNEGAILGGRGLYLSKGESYTDIGIVSDIPGENFRFLQEAKKHSISILKDPFLIEYDTAGLQRGVLIRKIYQVNHLDSIKFEGDLTLLQELETYDPKFEFNELNRFFPQYNPTNKKLYDLYNQEFKK